jgi:uncharacterized delta-60 repeat protein
LLTCIGLAALGAISSGACGGRTLLEGSRAEQQDAGTDAPPEADAGVTCPAAPGALDPTFGEGGKVRRAFSVDDTPDGTPGSWADALALAVHPRTGKIVLAGNALAREKNALPVLVQLLPDGTVDPAFRAAPLVLEDASGGSFNAVAFQDDEKIVATGYFAIGPYEAFVARFMPDGTLDSTFGRGGIFAASSGVALSAVAVGGDGSIVVAGSAGGHASVETIAMRLKSDGSPDLTFGDEGATMLGTSGNQYARAVAVQADGATVLGGGAAEARPECQSCSVLARLAPNGRPDPTFGEDGAARIQALTYVGGIALAGGFIYAAATSLSDEASTLLAARFQGDGSLDPSFGSGGLAVDENPGTAAVANRIALDAEGNVVVLGWGYTLNNRYTFRRLARFGPDGSPDRRFGQGGGAIDWGSEHEEYNDVAVQADGRILVAGHVNREERNREIVLARVCP